MLGYCLNQSIPHCALVDYFASRALMKVFDSLTDIVHFVPLYDVRQIKVSSNHRHLKKDKQKISLLNSNLTHKEMILEIAHWSVVGKQRRSKTLTCQINKIVKCGQISEDIFNFVQIFKTRTKLVFILFCLDKTLLTNFILQL